jgi:hypothetical protein
MSSGSPKEIHQLTSSELQVIINKLSIEELRVIFVELVKYFYHRKSVWHSMKNRLPFTNLPMEDQFMISTVKFQSINASKYVLIDKTLDAFSRIKEQEDIMRHEMSEQF